MADAQEVKARELATFPCRCGGKCSIAETEDGGAFAFHTIPYCEWFKAADHDALLDECEKHPEAWASLVRKMLD